ncbi:uncharacterized protein LOC8279170 [Ricinus communis]|uniref:Uncharacterized protein n=1 Tax=Ricinus communis TaxID=3988 RepID=B9RX32_RICCO|nr:uncharacterized protein LOC8279170 [Ricinus communis]EEF44061.1 conserved hypothetical protein [Ricinus communis]|eukprot:XP_002518301.1 uncharacterized protein LOC8279170 [Ricinus communis]
MKKIAGKALKAKGGIKVPNLKASVEEEIKPVSAAALAAAREAVIGQSHNHLHLRSSRLHHPPCAPWSAIVNTQLKSKEVPSTSSHICKFLGIVEPPGSDTSKLIANFIKLHNRQNPAKRKDRYFLDNLITLLSKEQKIGIGEIAKLLSN